MFLFLAFLTANALTAGNAILCTRDMSKFCYLVEGKDIFKSNGRPAPSPEDLSFNYIEGDEDYINATWKQKVSHLDTIEGYHLEVTSNSGDPTPYTFIINVTEIKEELLSEVTFSFDKVDIFLESLTTLMLYSLPLYNENTTDYYKSIMIQPKEPEYSPSYKSPDYFEPQDTQGIGRAPNYIQTENEQTAPSYSNQASPSTNHENSEGQQCTTSIVLASVISMLFTTVVALSILQATKKLHKTKGTLTDDQNNNVLILTSPTSTENHIDNQFSIDFYKKVALCLANTLQSSGEFDVSCNLWMTEEIAEKGIAIWAHHVMKTHSKVIILCNPGLKVQPDQLTTPHDSKYSSNTFVQLIRSFVRNASCDNSKFLVVCAEETEHSCFASMILPTLENCKHINIARDFQALVSALSRRTIERNKADLMGQNFARMVEKLRKQKSHAIEKTKLVCETEALPPTQKGEDVQLLYVTKHSRSRVHFLDKRYRNPSASSSNDGNIYQEIQFDSMYSSRCNSHSTETLSSGDESGSYGHKMSPQNISEQQQTGARTKEKVQSHENWLQFEA